MKSIPVHFVFDLHPAKRGGDSFPRTYQNLVKSFVGNLFIQSADATPTTYLHLNQAVCADHFPDYVWEHEAILQFFVAQVFHSAEWTLTVKKEKDCGIPITGEIHLVGFKSPTGSFVPLQVFLNPVSAMSAAHEIHSFIRDTP